MPGEDTLSPGAPPVRTVFICGSCVSRDAFAHLGDRPLRLGDYFARTSVASAFGSAPVDDGFSAALQSSFQRRQVAHDFGKTLQRQLPRTEADLIVLDFIDERFPLFRLDDGRVVTISSELGRSPFPGTLQGTRVPPFGDEHFALWDAGWRALVDSLRATGRLPRLRVNAVWWAARSESGAEFPAPMLPRAIDRANRYLARLYQRVALDLEPHQVLRYPPELFVGSEDHQWGLAPFHYTAAAYHTMLDLLAGGPPRST